MLVAACFGIIYDMQENTDANTPYLMNDTISGPITAFQAVSVALNDSGFKAWTNMSNNVSLMKISSDKCANGVSERWTLQYLSDTEEATIQVSAEGVDDMAVMPAGFKSARSGLVTTGTIDSIGAWDSAGNILKDITGEPHYSSGMILRMSPGGGVWDIKIPSDTGYYVLRIKASDGKLLESGRIDS